ncbi:hypothetical protein ACC809_37640, partial [Rhizobium johnstonii]
LGQVADEQAAGGRPFQRHSCADAGRHLAEEERIELFKRCARSSPTGSAEIDPGTLSEAAGKAFESRLSIQDGESDYAV